MLPLVKLASRQSRPLASPLPSGGPNFPLEMFLAPLWGLLREEAANRIHVSATVQPTVQW